MAESKLGTAVVPIRAALDALDKDLGEAKGKVDKAAGGLAEKLGSIGKVAAVGVGVGVAALTGLGVAAFKLGSDFDAAYDAIRVGTGATGAALEALKGDFKAVVSDVPTDFGLASQVIADLNTRTGATGETLQDLSKNILEMSRLTKTDAVGNVALATRVFGDWGVATQEQTGTLDMLFRASQATGISIGSLQGKVVQFGAPLRAMGFSLAESATMLGKWEKEGVNTELVLGSMRIAMGKFADAGVPMRKGLDDVMARITKLGPGAAATSLAMDTFGARAGPDMAAAILEGRFALGDLLKQIKDGDETIMGAAGDTEDLAEKWQKAMNKISVAVEPMASKVFDLVGEKLPGIIDAVLPAVEGLFNAIAPIAERVAGIVGAVAPFFQVFADQLSQGNVQGAFNVIGVAIDRVQGWLAEAVPKITAQLSQWAGAFLSWIGPLIPPFLGELVRLWLQLETWLWSQIPPLLANLAKWGQAFLAWVAPMIPPLLGEMGKLAGQAWEWVKQQVPLWLKQMQLWADVAIEWVKPAIPPLLKELGKLAGQAWEWIREQVPPLVEKLARWAGEFIAWVAPMIPPLLLELGKVIVGIGVWVLTTAVPELVRFALDMGGAIIRGLLQGLESLGRKLSDAIGTAIRSIKIDIGPFHLDASGFRIDGPSMPSISLPGGGGMASEPLLNYAGGGTVPGPLGQPRLAIVHGGEEIREPGFGDERVTGFGLSGPLVSMSDIRIADEEDALAVGRQAGEQVGRALLYAIDVVRGQGSHVPLGLVART